MNITKNIICILFFMMTCIGFSQTNQPPNISATGKQVYCPQSQLKIVTNFTITDIDDTEIKEFFIQISSGYNANSDVLLLTGIHPTVTTIWSSVEGKLTLSGAGGNLINLTALEAAIKDVVFVSSDATISEERYFSFTIDQANYLPSTQHFYEFVPAIGITWKDAKIAAENRTYYGLQGYLATIMSEDEKNITGEQSTGAGWIGGSDEEEDDVWKWVTGPEIGTVFWNGKANGTTPNYAFWNINEPNDSQNSGEKYAHITHGVGTKGAWNDLTNEGNPTGNYQPKGYIVEYGGMPGDPVVNLYASTSIFIPAITSTTTGAVCDTGTIVLSATASEGTVVWYDSLTSTTPLFTGINFTTPTINRTTTYYASLLVNGCSNYYRTPVIATINRIPTVLSVTSSVLCSSIPVTIGAIPSEGTIIWYDSITSTTPIFAGRFFMTTVTENTTFYAESVNKGCTSSTRTPVSVTIDPTIPEFTIEPKATLCLNESSVLLEPQNSQGNYTYNWFDQDDNLVSTSDTFTATTIGIYKVKAISFAGCESLYQLINVTESELSTFDKDDVIVNDFAEENYIEIVLGANLGIGDYEFALDDITGSYQTNLRFTNATTGIHTLYIRDKKGCGVLPYQFSILNYPRFFTPNNDGVNDIWTLKGFNTNFYTTSAVLIYNRYGNLITKLDANSDGWDGTINGKGLPSGGYWFSVFLIDINGFQVERKGSFSLLRM